MLAEAEFRQQLIHFRSVSMDPNGASLPGAAALPRPIAAEVAPQAPEVIA